MLTTAEEWFSTKATCHISRSGWKKLARLPVEILLKFSSKKALSIHSILLLSGRPVDQNLLGNLSRQKRISSRVSHRRNRRSAWGAHFDVEKDIKISQRLRGKGRKRKAKTRATCTQGNGKNVSKRSGRNHKRADNARFVAEIEPETEWKMRQRFEKLGLDQKKKDRQAGIDGQTSGKRRWDDRKWHDRRNEPAFRTHRIADRKGRSLITNICGT